MATDGGTKAVAAAQVATVTSQAEQAVRAAGPSDMVIHLAPDIVRTTSAPDRRS